MVLLKYIWKLICKYFNAWKKAFAELDDSISGLGNTLSKLIIAIFKFLEALFPILGLILLPVVLLIVSYLTFYQPLPFLEIILVTAKFFIGGWFYVISLILLIFIWKI